MHMIQKHVLAIVPVIVFILMHFRPFSTVHTSTDTMCMSFHFDPLSKRSVSVDRRPKRIEMYAFSNQKALVWKQP